MQYQMVPMQMMQPQMQVPSDMLCWHTLERKCWRRSALNALLRLDRSSPTIKQRSKYMFSSLCYRRIPLERPRRRRASRRQKRPRITCQPTAVVTNRSRGTRIELLHLRIRVANPRGRREATRGNRSGRCLVSVSSTLEC